MLAASRKPSQPSTAKRSRVGVLASTKRAVIAVGSSVLGEREAQFGAGGGTPLHTESGSSSEEQSEEESDINREEESEEEEPEGEEYELISERV